MDSITIAQNIILRYRQAQEREWSPSVSSTFRRRSSIYPHRERVAGRKRKLRLPEAAISSDDDAVEVTGGAHSHKRRPSSISKVSIGSPDTLSPSPGTPPLNFTQEASPPDLHIHIGSPQDSTAIADPLVMAVPPEITTSNLNGSYLLNRTLSDSSQQVLKMQGVNFAVRTAVAYSHVTVTLSQYIDPEGLKHLDQEQLSTGGIKNFEDRVMDGKFTDKYNWIWGKVHGKSKYVKIEDIEDGYLREGWSKDCIEGELVEGFVESLEHKWTALQIWGFAEVDGQRRHVRKILATKPGWKDQRIRMVYDWKPSA